MYSTFLDDGSSFQRLFSVFFFFKEKKKRIKTSSRPCSLPALHLPHLTTWRRFDTRDICSKQYLWHNSESQAKKTRGVFWGACFPKSCRLERAVQKAKQNVLQKSSNKGRVRAIYSLIFFFFFFFDGLPMPSRDP